MCGIVGCIGSNNVIPKIIDSLIKLEYRGYDSWGFAYKQNKYKIYKTNKDISKSKIKIKNIKSNISIGHTRWATHGIANKINAHPFESKNFIIVHNGIIKNYEEIKVKYNIITNSKTDTEVLLLLIEKLYDKYNDVYKSIFKSLEIIEGSYAFLLIDKNNDRIYFSKYKMSLFFSYNKDIIISSDPGVFLGYKYYYEILDNTIGYISCDGYNILNGDIIKGNINTYKLIPNKINKYYMLDEIYDSKNVINNIINNYYFNGELNIKKEILDEINKAKSIYFIACGSSYNACLYIKELLNKRVFTYIASEIIEKEIFIDEDPLFIYVSQSGETKDVYKVIDKYKEYKSISLTNNVDSIIAKNTTYTINLYCNCEVSVGATKSYISQVILLYMLFFKDSYRNIIEFNENINIIFNNIKIKQIAKKMYKKNSIILIGKSLDYVVSIEGALKLREICYINTLCLPSGELKHGSLALIKKGVPIILFNTLNNKQSILNINEAISRKAFPIIIQDDIFIPNINKDLKPLLGVITVQLLTYYIGLLKKINIDKPRNLAKSVTVE